MIIQLLTKLLEYLFSFFYFHECLGSSEEATYRGADKSLARPGRKQAPPVKSEMGRGMD